MQINVNPNGEHVYHIIAVHVKQHWFKDLLPTYTVALIADNSNVILEVQQRDVVEAFAESSGLNVFHQFLCFDNFLMSSILRRFPRVNQNSTCALAHNLTHSLVSNRVTRPSRRVLSSLHKSPVHSKRIIRVYGINYLNVDLQAKKKLAHYLDSRRNIHRLLLSIRINNSRRCYHYWESLRSAPTGHFGARIEDNLCSL